MAVQPGVNATVYEGRKPAYQILERLEMITRTIQEATVPGSDIIVTVIEETIRHIEPRQVFYAAYVMGSHPKTGEFFRKGFSRCPSERAARHAANGFWTTWTKLARELRS